MRRTRILGVDAEVAETFAQRTRGLIGRTALAKGEGMLITRCNCIHTFFMRFAIDATFLDGAGRVVKTVRGIKPGRPWVWGGWRARQVLETAAALALAVCVALPAAADYIDPDFEMRVLDAAAKVRAAGLRPMAFWDCDGTIIRGDICTGTDGRDCYPGLVEAGIHAGFSKIYQGADGYARFRDVDYPTLGRMGTWIAWPYVGQLFAGADAKEFSDFAHGHFRETMSAWYFRESFLLLRRLEQAGIENHVISGSPEYFIKALDETLGLPAERLHGLGNIVRDGVITHEVTYPVTDAKGKTRILKRLLAARGGAAVAAFGNRYSSDGDFMLFTVTNALPDGAKGQALMINGMRPNAALKPHFTCVALEDVMGGQVVKTLNDAQASFFAIPRAKRAVLFDDPTNRVTFAKAGDAPPGAEIRFDALTNATVRGVRLTVRWARNGRIFFAGDVAGGCWHFADPEVAARYVWTAESALGMRSGLLIVQGMPPRLVDVPGVPNVRDLGGWLGFDGRRVRQGLVYRTAGLNDNPPAFTWDMTSLADMPKDAAMGKVRLDAAGTHYLTNALGIRTDLDLRSDMECWKMTGSPAGPRVRWAHVPSRSYAAFFTPEGQAAFKKCFALFLDGRNYPIAFHCIAGQDRTGTLAFTLLALLGVSEEDICRDWMATAFYNPDTTWFRYAPRYAVLLECFQALPGATLPEKVERYVLSLGFTKGDLAKFRAIMLER